MSSGTISTLRGRLARKLTVDEGRSVHPGLLESFLAEASQFPMSFQVFDRISTQRRPSWVELRVMMPSLLVVLLAGLMLEPYLGHLAVGIFLLIVIAISGLYFSRFSNFFIFSTLIGLGYQYLIYSPAYSFALLRPEDQTTLFSLFVGAVVSGSLVLTMRSQAVKLRAREQNTRLLYVLARQLAQTQSLEDAAHISCAAISKLVNQTLALFLLERESNEFHLIEHAASSYSATSQEKAELVQACEEAFDVFGLRNTSSGRSFFPLIGREGIIGLMLISRRIESAMPLEHRQILETSASQIAVAIEREVLHDRGRAVELMEQTQKLYKTLLNSVSHELKTPLVAITGSASAMLDPETMPDPSLVPVLAKEILVASQRLRRVVENLLDMSRIDSGMLKPRREICDARDLLAVVLSRLEEEGRVHPVELDFAHPILDIYVDPVLVDQALTNVIHNAQQYTPAGTRVEVRIAQEGPSVVINVRDHGPGLKEQDLSNVFKRFYRGSPQNPGGLGLGLAIAEGFIEAQGGKITATNAVGGGAQFTIKLPAWRGS